MKIALIKGHQYKKWILFYPIKPSQGHVLYKITKMLNYGRTNLLPPQTSNHLAIVWEPCTYRYHEYSENLPLDTLNINCKDISKSTIDRAFKEVFGYGLTIDPSKASGMCLKKSEFNATHDGRVEWLPLKKEKGFVTQKLIDNQWYGLYETIRMPIFKDLIPFVYLKYKTKSDRFGNKNKKIKLTNWWNVIAVHEKDKILLVYKKIGLDYGEADFVRGKDGKLYLLDINNTPFGPPSPLSYFNKKTALKKMAACFERLVNKKEDL